MSQSIDKRADFSRIRYANCWEDGDVLLKGLAVKENSSCLSISSAGDNTLALLAGRPRLVVAVDISRAQLACLELRVAAIERLDYDNLLKFLGVEHMEHRLDVYKSDIRENLSSAARSFWDSHEELISRGVIFGGKFERYFSLFRNYALPFVHSRKRIGRLLEHKSIAERKYFYRTQWNSRRWRLMFRIFFSRFMMGKAGRDEEFFKYVEGSVSKKILERTMYALTELPTHSNPYLHFILTGSYQGILPYYLQRDNLRLIRKNLKALELYNGTCEAAINHYGIKFDAFNLSDIFEYMDVPMFRKTARNLLKYANQGARLAYWNMLVPRRVAQIFPEKVTHLKELSSELFKQDRAFFYQSFMVDEVG